MLKRLVAFAAASLVALGLWGQPKDSVLLSYVWRDDGAFQWVKEGETKTPVGVTLHELRFTSQR